MKLDRLHIEGRQVQDHYVGPYGLGYDRAREVWDKIRNHPLFVDEVRKHVAYIQAQIDKTKAEQAGSHGLDDNDEFYGMKQALRGAMVGLGELSDVATQVAKDTGYGDPKDIMIAIQRHPLVLEKLAEREALPKS